MNIKLLKVTIKNRAAYLKPSQKLTFSTQKKRIINSKRYFSYHPSNLISYALLRLKIKEKLPILFLFSNFAL
ncbi:hypothetical protein JCM15754A_01990 [Prevotella aurantiaca JCM 15754]